MSPLAWQWAITQMVATNEPRILPFSIRRRPAGADRIDEMPIAGQARVRAVAAVESDALPIHKITRCPCGRPHRVVVINHPGAAFAHAAGPIIEANRDALLRDIAGGDLQRPEECRAKVHALI